MCKNLVFDSCVIIDFLKKKSEAIDLEPLRTANDCFISFISKLETLGFPEIQPDEEAGILQFLPQITILPSTSAIEAEVIQIRRKTKLKLPDAIIAATAIVIDAEVVTTDEHFLKCEYPRLTVWRKDAESFESE
ncbi:hypothetical protein AGMMS4952_02290 [Spirochaetia bacterium]|nr:hypothetical protein AGMMS4952_02290 [Spirochaetia bacterium]